MTVTTQPDHARFAAELLSLWRTDGLPEHPRRDDLLFATREHDNGWQEADAAPRVDRRTHRPFDFRDYPTQGRLEIWQRGIFRFAEARPWVALLLTEHAKVIHQPLGPEWNDFFEQLQPHRQDWVDRVRIEPSLIERDYRFLALADTLSLALCTAAEGPLEVQGINGRVDGDLLCLEPFPLAGTTTFRIPVRWVAKRPYDSDLDFASALARARWEHRRVKVGPGSAAAA